MKKEFPDLLQRICQAIVDKKGKNIIVLDVRNVTNFADYFIIAEGTVDRHVQAISKEIVEALKKENREPVCEEGLREGDWVVLDFSEIVVHIFTHEMRMRYSLEEVWKEGSLVQVTVD